MLCPTPPEKLVDARGRPYFLWDEDVSLAGFRERLAVPGAGDYWLATLLRQAKPDDVYGFVSLPEIAQRWASVRAGVGRMREFWEWRVRRWQTHGD